jgi:uncharacterized protein YbjT (DUF2867 family)
VDPILLTGGTGVFGRHLLPRLLHAHRPVRVLSRQPPPADLAPDVEWVVADLREYRGLAAAAAGAPIIIHAASSAARDTAATDVDGTARLLAAARDQGCAHFIYLSIVGIERAPHPYYRAKLEAEALVQASGLPWSVLRATQFHNLLYAMLQPWMKWPVAWLRADFVYQPVHPGEVAQYLLEHLDAGTTGRWRDFAGPQVLTLGELAAQWTAVRGRGPRVLRRPSAGPFARAMRAGVLTAPDRAAGRITWAEWLRR